MRTTATRGCNIEGCTAVALAASRDEDRPLEVEGVAGGVALDEVVDVAQGWGRAIAIRGMSIYEGMDEGVRDKEGKEKAKEQMWLEIGGSLY